MEIKDILGYLGAENEFESPEQFKEFFQSNFVRKQTALEDESIRKAIIGSTFKSVGQNIRKGLKDKYELEVSNSELDNKNLEDFVFDNIEKIKGSYESKLKELQTQITEPNEALKEFESKYTSLDKRYKETQNALKAVEGEYNSFKEKSANELKNYKIDRFKQDTMSKIKFKQEISDIEKIGYDNLLNSKYSLDFDSNEDVIITDKNGNRIQNERVVGKFKTPQEIFEEEAISNKLIAISQHESKPIQKNTIFVSNSDSWEGNPRKKVFFGTPR